MIQTHGAPKKQNLPAYHIWEGFSASGCCCKLGCLTVVFTALCQRARGTHQHNKQTVQSLQKLAVRMQLQEERRKTAVRVSQGHMPGSPSMAALEHVILLMVL
jgi:hypothetical protein